MKKLGWIAFLAILGATAAMAGAYAWNTGHAQSELWAWLFAAAVGALLFAEAALAAGRGPVPPFLRWLALAVVAAAVFSLEAGFVSSAFTDARAARASDAREAKQAEALAEAVDEPAAVIKVRLEAIEGRHRGISAKWCGSPNQTARDACDAWTTARMQLAAAEKAEKRHTTGDPDARAALLSRVLGGVQERWADGLVLLLALALSLARVATASLVLGAPAAVCNVHDNAKPAAEAPKPATVQQDRAAPLTAIEPVETEPEQQDQPAAPPKPIAVDPPAELPRPVRKVLRVVAEHAQPAPEGLGYVGFVPPGTLSQRALAERAGMSRRHTAEHLDTLQQAGVLRVVSRGRDGTEFAILTPVDGAPRSG